MGQNSSVPSAGQAKQETLYEILGVESTVTEAELKKIYKKLALQLHPDRNYQNPEEATKRFAKVQAAYDVLIDPQERAWYDNHGSESNGRGPSEPEYGGKVTTAEELKAYLDPEVYQEYFSSDPETFYDQVGKLFSQLAEEEHEAALDQNVEAPLLPPFGDDNSAWEKHIKPFYDVWSSYSSIKTFAWEDLYRAWDAPDRRTRRAMEMRNKKIRDASRKEFNGLVRSLVVLVRRKDPRVKKHNKAAAKRDEASTSTAAKAAAKEKSKKEKEARAAQHASEYVPQEWEVAQTEEDEADVNEDDEVVELYECIVCDKLFKTKKQLIAHESSKKHVKTLKQLQKEMRKEGVELGLDISDPESDTDEGIDNEPSTNSTQDLDIEDENKLDLDNAVNGKSEEPSLEDLLSQLEGLRADSSTPPAKEQPSKKSGKAKQRRAKKEKSINELANKCATCNAVFTSRNKLFEHVKVSRHSAPI